MTTCYNAVFIYFFKAEMIGQETKGTGLLNDITNIGILRLHGKYTIFEIKKKYSLHLHF